MEPPMGKPIFCVSTVDKISKIKTYFNFRYSDSVPYPDGEFTDEDIIRLASGPGTGNEQYNIPLQSSPIFWNNEETNDDQKEKKTKERSYVIEIMINDKFALRKVLISNIMKRYLICVTFIAVEEKYNTDKYIHTRGHFIGHELDFDQLNHKILKDRLFMDRSKELVNNKITVLDMSKDVIEQPQSRDSTPIYDLYFRPSSKILTCCIRTDKLPESISFNDDRLIVESEENKLVDIFLPIYIDLKEPMKYKFDDKLLLLRVVFKTIDEPFKISTMIGR